MFVYYFVRATTVASETARGRQELEFNFAILRDKTPELRAFGGGRGSARYNEGEAGEGESRQRELASEPQPALNAKFGKSSPPPHSLPSSGGIAHRESIGD